MQIFEEVLFFKLRTTTKTEKQTINLTYLVSVGCRRLAEEKGHETDCFVLFCRSPFFPSYFFLFNLYLPCWWWFMTGNWSCFVRDIFAPIVEERYTAQCMQMSIHSEKRYTAWCRQIFTHSVGMLYAQYRQISTHSVGALCYSVQAISTHSIWALYYSL